MSDAHFIEECIDSRRTCHRYQPEAIDPKLLHRALELALTAPNHKFTFPWKFVICGKESRMAIYETVLKKAKAKAEAQGEDPNSVVSKIQEKFLNPSALVVFARKNHEDEKIAKEDYATISCSIQNFCLFLQAHDYFTKWSTGSITKSEETYQLLKLDQSSFTIEGFVWVGKPLVGAPPRRRPQLKDVLEELP